MPAEASIILAELTRLEINQAEIIKQIDRIESGDADILYTHITTSTGVQLLSQESFLSALKQEKETVEQRAMLQQQGSVLKYKREAVNHH